MNWENKVAVVTGANRGLGLECSRQLSKLGVKVVMACRSASAGREAADQLQQEGLNNLYVFPLDVRDEKQIITLKQFIKKEFGKLDILINNAGVFLDRRGEGQIPSFFTIDCKTLEDTLITNLFGPILLCRELIPLMKGNGRIVNVSSRMGQLSSMRGGFPSYRISKTTLNALTKILADELSKTNIKINSVCPGWVKTDMGGKQAEVSLTEGVNTIIWLATLPNDGPNGGFFKEMTLIPF